MKGRQHFTIAETNIIRGLLEKKTNAGRNDQKRIRHNLRSIGFYITDFAPHHAKAFTVSDFENLIQSKDVLCI
jgi:hypothetical protein